MIRFADPQGVHSYAWPSLGRQNSEQLEHDRCFNRHFFAWIALFLHILALVIRFLLIEYLQVYQVCMFLNVCATHTDLILYYIYICVCAFTYAYIFTNIHFECGWSEVKHRVTSRGKRFGHPWSKWGLWPLPCVTCLSMSVADAICPKFRHGLMHAMPALGVRAGGTQFGRQQHMSLGRTSQPNSHRVLGPDPQTPCG